MLNPYQTGYLRDVNPWWNRTREVSYPQWVDRDETAWVLSSIGSGVRLLYLTGARRVGKSTVLRQATPRLAERCVTLYASAEDLIAYGGGVGLVDELLAFLETEVVVAPLASRPVVLLLDEIHHLPRWQQQVKRFYDARPNLSFVLTSSQSPRVQKGKESLAGRVLQRELLPFSFGESLRLLGVPCPPALGESAQCWRRFFAKRDVAELRDGLTDCFRQLSPSWNELATQFALHLRRGGFPEWAGQTGAGVAREYFRDAIVSKVINEDIPAGFGVTDRALLQRLFHIALSRSGNEINMSGVASQLGVGRVTVNNYFHYLAETHLIHFVPRHAASMVGRSRSFFKVFAADSGLFWTFEQLARHSESELIGPAAEIAVHTALRRLAGAEASCCYYRDRQKREVDFLLELGPGQHLPIDVKTAPRVPTDADRLLQRMMAELKAPVAVALSNEGLSVSTSVLHVPLLMLCA
ncbi:MAG: ATP-binding protein [Planctomycetes bacterium]|nr:ATP-binding protein [Planctomycetota bacterium]